MLTYAGSALIFFLLLAPGLTLLHELGHAVVPLTLERAKVNVRVGPALAAVKKPLLTTNHGRLQIQWTGLFFPWQGFCRWSYISTRARTIWALAAGPIVSLSLALLFALALWKFSLPRLPYALLLFCACFTTLQGLATMLPLAYPRFLTSVRFSDGYQIKQLLADKPPLSDSELERIPAAGLKPVSEQSRAQ